MRSEKIADVLIKLKRLAEDQRGKPEGEAALRKIRELIEKYPETRSALKPYWEFTGHDFVFLKRHGINTDGVWEGRDFHEAIRRMQEHYCRLYLEYIEKQNEMIDAAILEIESNMAKTLVEAT